MTKKPPRKFRVASGATVVLPRSTMTGPGATNVVLKGRAVAHRTEEDVDELEIEADKVDRFIRQRIRSGDLIELEPAAGGSQVRIAEGSQVRDPIDLDDLPAPPTKRR